jgi:hypothetical protein
LLPFKVNETKDLSFSYYTAPRPPRGNDLVEQHGACRLAHTAFLQFVPGLFSKWARGRHIAAFDLARGYEPAVPVSSGSIWL